jgi:hypothetical protein
MNDKICTTLKKIWQHRPCVHGWCRLLVHLGKTRPDDEPLPLVTVLESNNFNDALWCLRTVPEHSNLWRHLAADYAERIKYLLIDRRSVEALRVARAHADGLATDKQLERAHRRAVDAADAIANKDQNVQAAQRCAAWVAEEVVRRKIFLFLGSVAYDATIATYCDKRTESIKDEMRTWQHERLRLYLTTGRRPADA